MIKPQQASVESRPRRSLVVRIAKWFLIVIAFVVVVRSADYIWYSLNVPKDFRSANWGGTWKTHYYFLSGKLLVRMPESIPENEDFEAKAVVYYPIYSIWQTGRFVKMDFTGNFSPDTSSSGGESKKQLAEKGETTRKYEVVNKFDQLGKKGMLHFKASAGDQVVEYVAMLDATGTRIIGSYVSKAPADIGYFCINEN